MEHLALAILLALLAAIIYTIIGIVPGTDETASMAPLTLILVLMGVPAPALLAWFMAAIAAMETANGLPAAVAAIPGSTMAVPFIPSCVVMRKIGLPHLAMRKLMAGSVLGAFVAIPIAVLFGHTLAPLADKAKALAPMLFTGGAIVLALLTKSRWASLISLLPLAFVIQGLMVIGKQATGKIIFISIFMGIAIGPMIIDLLLLLAPSIRPSLTRHEPLRIAMASDATQRKKLFPNPLGALTKRQALLTILLCCIASTTFTLSPVGMTVLLGGFAMFGIRELYHKHATALSVMDGVTHATYIAETLIPLVAFGLPLSPMGLGPAAPLFNAPPRFTIDPVRNLHTMLTTTEFFWYAALGTTIGLLVSYPLCMNYAHAACRFVFQRVSHEALIGCFSALVLLLSFYEAGLCGMVLALSIGAFGGFLNKYLGVNIGVQFMAYYASGWVVSSLLSTVR